MFGSLLVYCKDTHTHTVLSRSLCKINSSFPCETVNFKEPCKCIHPLHLLQSSTSSFYVVKKGAHFYSLCVNLTTALQAKHLISVVWKERGGAREI